MDTKEEELTPKQIVKKLDDHIIGQNKAKKMVAIALRNRYRRRKIKSPELREDIQPKNIIMIGPTGVGKTEIARRLSKLCAAPFIKVEATKYTEVGYVGRDIESMIRDLATVSFDMVKKEERENLKEVAKKKAEDTILDILLPPTDLNRSPITPEETERLERYNKTREVMKQKLLSGKLDDTEIEIESKQQSGSMPMLQIFGANNNMEELDNQIQNMIGDILPKKLIKKKLKIKEAYNVLLEEEADKLLDIEKIKDKAKKRIEEMGIVFVDEIDKITGKSDSSRGDVSREGVQRDLLPIVEGTTVNTRIGTVKTEHILFIAAGAFHISKPSDLIPELQGRFPIRVELEKLTMKDFVEILHSKRSSLIKQYKALLETENVAITFEEDAISEIAKIAYDMNETLENIGARRLNTIMEILLEDISFEASDLDEKDVIISRKFVLDKMKNLLEDKDLSSYIL